MTHTSFFITICAASVSGGMEIKMNFEESIYEGLRNYYPRLCQLAAIY